ncbi:LPP20 family lipoprotein [Calditrichota bacterium GD2]
MKILFRMIIALLFIQFWQCSYAQKSSGVQRGSEKPPWVNNPYEVYSEHQYLVGVGSGDTREAAEKNAMGQIAKIFKTHVQVDETLIESVFESFKKNKSAISSETNILNRTRLQSDVQLKNVKIGQVFFSEKEGLYYALAYLDRAETAALLEQDFNENNLLLKRYYETSQSETNKLRQLANINKALALAQVNSLINEQYKVLTGGDGLELAVSDDALQNAARKIREAIVVQISGEGPSAEEIAAYLREVLGRFGFSMGRQNPHLSIRYQLEMNKTDLNRPGVVAYNWHFKIDVNDLINQTTLKTFNLNKRSAAISEDEVRARVLRTIKKALTTKFYKQLMDYFNSF